MATIVHLFCPKWRARSRGMEGRDIKRIILGLVSLTYYAGPVRPTRILHRCYARVQKANGHPYGV